jgi:UDP:flavonoid glycosyltransferase YjiC (YdhE family)
MPRIVLATLGSLGDLHPKIALAIELRSRGHDVVINTFEAYREKIGQLGFEFRPMRPDIDQNDQELLADLMHPVKGPEKVLRELVLPHLHEMFEDLETACEGADLVVTGELIYVVRSLVERTAIKWISTSLAPMSMFSSVDPNVYPQVPWMEILRPLPTAFHRSLFAFMRSTVGFWFEPYKTFRRELGLSEDHDPAFLGKYSPLMNLALFSRALAKPQDDWWQPTIQTGFCFYDGQDDTGRMPECLEEFLASGEPPIVFTLGSAAVLDPGDFFDESAKAAKILGSRAVLLYGTENDPPKGLTENIVGFPYAPFSRVFPKSVCVVHQGGVGTTGQVLRAGVPHLIMPYSHDQPDNAARCRRKGYARIVRRGRYTAKTAAAEIKELLDDPRYAERNREAAAIVVSEHGAETACNAIESVLQK